MTFREGENIIAVVSLEGNVQPVNYKGSFPVVASQVLDYYEQISADRGALWNVHGLTLQASVLVVENEQAVELANIVPPTDNELETLRNFVNNEEPAVPWFFTMLRLATREDVGLSTQ